MRWDWRGRGWPGRGWAGPWPGRGPFSYLPPWQRPGWLFGFGRGFGRGWWCAYPPCAYPPAPSAPAMSPEDELAALEDYMKNLEAERADLGEEIKKVEARIKELKDTIGRESEQGT